MRADAPGRRWFGPVVLAGLGGSGLATLAANRPWFAYDEALDLAPVAGLADTVGQVPLAAALGLVCLAAWGALLVTRGRLRRALAGLAALAAAGVLAAWAWAWGTVPATLADDAAALGAADVSTHATGWYALAGAGALVALGAAVAGVSLAPGWPEMGRRYDAPATAAALTQDRPAPERPVQNRPAPDRPGQDADEEVSGRDLWRALDEGRDPTAGEE